MIGRVLASLVIFGNSASRLESLGPTDSLRSGHDARVTDQTPPDLEKIRDELDLVDRRLLDVLIERASLIASVISFKRAHGMRVVDRPREEEMLQSIGDRAGQRGLDPRIARQVLRAVIDAFTLLEVEQLGRDTSDSGLAEPI